MESNNDGPPPVSRVMEALFLFLLFCAQLRVRFPVFVLVWGWFQAGGRGGPHGPPFPRGRPAWPSRGRLGNSRTAPVAPGGWVRRSTGAGSKLDPKWHVLGRLQKQVSRRLQLRVAMYTHIRVHACPGELQLHDATLKRTTIPVWVIEHFFPCAFPMLH